MTTSTRNGKEGRKEKAFAPVSIPTMGTPEKDPENAWVARAVGRKVWIRDKQANHQP
jgi:hypothetical protein